MSSYKNILLATDFASDAEIVIDRAAETAGLYGAQLWVIHVMNRVPVAYNDPTGVIADQYASLQLELERSAADQMSKLQERLGVPTECTRVCTGRASTEIHKYAEETGVDLIVLGTHGQHGLELLLGSTANAVIHGIKCDSLIVRVGGD